MNTSLDRSHSTPNLGHRRNRSRSPGGGGSDHHNQPRDRERGQYDARYREQADLVIRDLHQNKSDLVKPSGENTDFFLSSLVRDFKHFHLTSHIKRKVKDCIKGQDFTVDFRRLLPKSKAKIKYDNRMQVVNQDGETYFVPAGDRDTREINSYKTWEIAFKVFMGIFNQHWPERMNELLQYSHVIQTAAQNHPWENVYNYDISFREIMSGQPNTHWGMISQQTWTLELGDHNSKGVQHPAPEGNSISQVKQSQRSRNPCWRYNKGRCTFGESCEFDHRCSHCGKKGHGRHECFRRVKSEKGKRGEKEKSHKN